MPRRFWHLIALAQIPALIAAMPASAQDQRLPQADLRAYPCGSTPKLRIVERDNAFAILSAHPAPEAAAMPLREMIAIGQALKVDRLLLDRPNGAAREASDAPAR
ncbi:hypothetical protein [Sphingomonas sp. OTU376]|uniref:hypothetical protein n=1 Tax=Sphingomonas sp. OTU376 TaxID=3043863 RepID=UPI00313AFD6C